jgi:periplasmic divalent cation tolerance protein
MMSLPNKLNKIQPETILLVFTNMPDVDSANTLAEMLIQQKLAACVNILGACQSIYRWQGKIEHANEIPVMIKTSQARYHALETAILKAHPYELPEIIAIHVDGGAPKYLQWVNAQLSLGALKFEVQHF